MKKNYASFLFAGISLLTISVTQAQVFTKSNQYRSVGLSINATNYFGDLTPKVSAASARMAAARPGFSLHATQRLTPRWSGRAALTYGRITGSDANATGSESIYRSFRNLNFKSNIFELSAVGVFDLVPNHSQAVYRMGIVPYVFGGVALFHFNPKGEVSGGTIPASLRMGQAVALQPLRTEGQFYSRTQFALPFGGGVRMRVTKDIDVGLELGWRKTFTDYLDDVSTIYVAPSQLASPAARYFGHDITLSEPNRPRDMNVPGALRGNSDGKDWYIVSGVTVSYILPQERQLGKFR